MTVESLPKDRRSDLDAVRSFAMLLGIGLHAAMAYIGAAWMVSDGRTEPLLGLFVVGTHGFRMPLFFLLSGFFSAMLWRRRGLGGLISHRARRILLPLAVGCLTIVPLTWLATNWALSASARAAKAASSTDSGTASDLWQAAAMDDIEAVRRFAGDPALLNALDPKLGVTPLGWAAVWGKVEATRVLLELGADPSGRYRDGNTPLHTACFFGRGEVAELLLNAGGDVNAKSAVGERPADALRHDKQTTEFIAGLLKVSVNYEEVVAGRERIRSLMSAGGGAETGKARAGGDGVAAADRKAVGLVARLQRGTFFQHLWFLWFLCWLNAGLGVVIVLARWAPRLMVPRALVSFPLCLVWLVPVTMVPQHFMHMGGTAVGFGPDTSAGIIPVPHVLTYYAVFFGFGVLVCLVRGQDARLGRFWWASLPIALVILPFALMFAYEPARAMAIIKDDTARRLVGDLLDVVYAWLATFGVLGVCEAVFAKPRRWVRFLSDSAYWQYLAHLPLVIVGQVLLLPLEMPALVKCAILTIGCIVILVTCYRFLVRGTIIGRLLNGAAERHIATSERGVG